MNSLPPRLRRTLSLPVLLMLFAAAISPATPASAAVRLGTVSPEGATAAPVVRLDATVEGFVAYDANRPPNGQIPGRIFDPVHGQLALSTAMIALEVEGQRSSARVALWRGWTPSVIYSGEPAGTIDWSLVQEAWAAVRTGDRVTVAAGLFGSPIGLESVFARDNWAYSSSQLNLAMPFYHAGSRAQVRLSGGMTVEAGVYGGWGQLVASNIPSTLIIRAFGASKGLDWQLLASGAPSRPQLGLAGVGRARGWLVDGFVRKRLSSRLEVATQAQVGAETWRAGAGAASTIELAPWAAAAVYARLAMAQAWKMTARLEHFWQGGDATNRAGQVLGRLWWQAAQRSAATLSTQWRADAAVRIRLDLRLDRADEAVFATAAGGHTTLRPTASLALIWTL